MARQAYSAGLAVMNNNSKQPKRLRLKLGDVIEVVLEGGFRSYVQYIYKHREPPHWGTLIRVLPGQYASSLTEFAWIDEAPETFIVFCPIATYVNHGDMEVVANRSVPDRLVQMPLFRAAARNISTGNSTWWIWDGKTETYVGSLDNEMINLPIRQLIDHQELKSRISTGWTPAQDV